MNKQVLDFLVLCLGAAINFPMLAVTMVYLGSPEGRRKTIYLLIGSEIVLLILGILILNISPVYLDLNIRGRFSHEFDQAVAIILLMLGIFNLFRKDEGIKDKENKIVKSNWQCLMVGFGMMIINFNTLVLYVAAMKNAMQISPDAINRYLMLIISNIIITIMAWLPLVINLISPELSQKIFGSFNKLISKYKKQIISIVLFVISIYLFFR